MPYVSKAQQGFFHSPGAAKAGIAPATVAEWDAASKGQRHLPPMRKDSPAVKGFQHARKGHARG